MTTLNAVYHKQMVSCLLIRSPTLLSTSSNWPLVSLKYHWNIGSSRRRSATNDGTRCVVCKSGGSGELTTYVVPMLYCKYLLYRKYSRARTKIHSEFLSMMADNNELLAKRWCSLQCYQITRENFLAHWFLFPVSGKESTCRSPA